MFMCMLKIVGNLIYGLLNVSLLGIHLLGYKCYHPQTRKVYVFRCYICRNKKIFSWPQGETLSKEEKDRDLYLLEFPIETNSNSSNTRPKMVSITHQPITQPEIERYMRKSQDIVNEEQIQGSTCPLLTYSRKKAPITQPMQVQSPESHPIEVIANPISLSNKTTKVIE